jgi:hypothetical protein
MAKAMLITVAPASAALTVAVPLKTFNACRVR